MSKPTEPPAARDGAAPSAVCDDARQSSPCVQVCVIHSETGLCLGCARSRDEIRRWRAMTHEERGTVLAALPGRAAHPKKRRGGRARARRDVSG